MAELLTCYLQSCGKPGVIRATGKVAIDGPLQEVEIAFCQEHSRQLFGDLTGLFSIDPKEAPSG